MVGAAGGIVAGLHAEVAEGSMALSFICFPLTSTDYCAARLVLPHTLPSSLWRLHAALELRPPLPENICNSLLYL